MRAVVCLKQVIDPLIPVSSYEIDSGGLSVHVNGGGPPVINGFDEQALEAALRLRDQLGDLEIIAVSVGAHFDLEIMKRALAVAADQLILVEDKSTTWDPYRTAATLKAVVHRLGGADIVLCGRQSSDWSSGLVPFILAEELEMGCVTLARKLEVHDSRLVVDRVVDGGQQVMLAEMPAVVTVTSELGELRYPTPRERLAAARRQPERIKRGELVSEELVSPEFNLTDLAIPVLETDCQFIDASDPRSAGAELAHILGEFVVSSESGGS